MFDGHCGMVVKILRIFNRNVYFRFTKKILYFIH